ncbi:hypothetical protein ACFRCW_43855 [Streptomyces sp. NPDC056653]|uniref:hypothetical protein n=1 Tax=Streptomyces sp. NPDC056653 TaxID=3345894 RepID=UPI0036BC499C
MTQALDALGFALTRASGRYGRYMDLLDTLLSHSGQQAEGWTARDLDTALYWIGGNGHQLPAST